MEGIDGQLKRLTQELEDKRSEVRQGHFIGRSKEHKEYTHDKITVLENTHNLIIVRLKLKNGG